VKNSMSFSQKSVSFVKPRIAVILLLILKKRTIFDETFYRNF